MKRRTFLAVVLLALTACSTHSPNPVPEDIQPERETASHSEQSPAQPTPEEGRFAYAIDERIPQEVRELVVGNREACFRLDAVGLERIRQDYLSYEMYDEADQQIAAQILLEPAPYPASLTGEQANRDVDFLFGYLRYGYAGYGYMGGDPVFLPIKDRIVEELDGMGEDIDVEAFEELLARHLMPLIVDSHFILGTTRSEDYHAHLYYSVNESERLSKLGDAFYIAVDGADYRLESVNGDPPEEFVKPILTQDGHLAWALGVRHHDPAAPSLELTLVECESGERITKAVALTTAEQFPDHTNNKDLLPYEMTRRSGIPIVQSRRMWSRDEQEEASLQQLVADAAELRGEPVIIVDLRGNTGGSSEWGMRWIEELSGSRPADHYIYCVMNTNTVASSYGESAGDLSPHWLDPQLETAEIIPNDQLVLVLTDQHTGSSAELFLAGLWQMENVVVIGTNTNGMMAFGDVRTVYMPESHLKIGCGYKLFLEPDLQFYECVGRSPDLWTPPDEALERAALFAQRHIMQ